MTRKHPEADLVELDAETLETEAHGLMLGLVIPDLPALPCY